MSFYEAHVPLPSPRFRSYRASQSSFLFTCKSRSVSTVLGNYTLSHGTLSVYCLSSLFYQKPSNAFFIAITALLAKSTLHLTTTDQMAATPLVDKTTLLMCSLVCSFLRHPFRSLSAAFTRRASSVDWYGAPCPHRTIPLNDPGDRTSLKLQGKQPLMAFSFIKQQPPQDEYLDAGRRSVET